MVEHMLSNFHQETMVEPDLATFNDFFSKILRFFSQLDWA